MDQVSNIASEVITPYLVAIYADGARPPHVSEQIGTGIRMSHEGKSFLVTAKHVLFGNDGTGNASEKCIFAGHGPLRRLGHLGPANVVHDLDLAVVRIEAFSEEPCLPSPCLSADEGVPPLLTIIGFLARDFKRSVAEERVGLTSLVHTDNAVGYKPGNPAVRYKRKSVSRPGSDISVRAPSLGYRSQVFLRRHLRLEPLSFGCSCNLA